jgi:hypothetical protein
LHCWSRNLFRVLPPPVRSARNSIGDYGKLAPGGGYGGADRQRRAMLKVTDGYSRIWFGLWVIVTTVFKSSCC